MHGVYHVTVVPQSSVPCYYPAPHARVDFGSFLRGYSYTRVSRARGKSPIKSIFTCNCLAVAFTKIASGFLPDAAYRVLAHR